MSMEASCSMVNHINKLMLPLSEDLGPIRNQAVSEKTSKNYMILYIYIAQEQGHITLGNKVLIVTKSIFSFDHTLQVSAISFNTF